MYNICDVIHVFVLPIVFGGGDMFSSFFDGGLFGGGGRSKSCDYCDYIM